MSNNTSMQELNDIRELSSAEIDAVNGAGFWEAFSALLVAIGGAVLVATALNALMDWHGPEVSG